MQPAPSPKAGRDLRSIDPEARHWGVSTLARPEGRARPDLRRVLELRHPQFQPSPDPKAGRDPPRC
ncbi:MAG TPA: hypothetical protein VFS21_26620 [Roseiflexaceae bacterium]|nr:hypothetical protein [Roseiflexaceae bacterium]